MNTNDNELHDQDADDGMPDALRLQLRGLRRDALPRQDLWAGIAARIAAEDDAQQAVTTNVVTLYPRRRRTVTWLAMAASLTLAVGIGWQLRPSAPVAAPAATPVAAQERHTSELTATIYLREADALGWEYKAALREIDSRRVSANDARTLRQLDQGVAQVRSALAEDPQARFLFDRLQKLYAQRLALTQRLALS